MPPSPTLSLSLPSCCQGNLSQPLLLTCSVSLALYWCLSVSMCMCVCVNTIHLSEDKSLGGSVLLEIYMYFTHTNILRACPALW